MRASIPVDDGKYHGLFGKRDEQPGSSSGFIAIGKGEERTLPPYSHQDLFLTHAAVIGVFGGGDQEIPLAGQFIGHRCPDYARLRLKDVAAGALQLVEAQPEPDDDQHRIMPDPLKIDRFSFHDSLSNSVEYLLLPLAYQEASLLQWGRGIRAPGKWYCYPLPGFLVRIAGNKFSFKRWRITIEPRDRLLRPCQVVVDQPRALDMERMGDGPLTSLTPEEMAAVEHSLKGVLGLL